MNKAYFLNIKEQIKYLIKNANEEILVAMAWFTNEELLDELIASLKRGIKVNLILLDHPINWMPYAPDFNQLISAGGHLYIANLSIGFMHHKFCVVDNDKVVSGSYNWTHYAEIRNIENVIISDDEGLSTSFRKEFFSLLTQLSETTESPRLSWEDIEEMAKVTAYGMDEFHYEIREIADEKHWAIPPISFASNNTYKAIVSNSNAAAAEVGKKAIVRVVEQEETSFSQYEIGIETEEGWAPFINRNDKLPAQNTQILYLDKDVSNSSDYACNVCIKDNIHPHGNSIMNLPLSKLMQKCANNSRVKITITLETNGYLHTEIQAEESGQKIDASVIEYDILVKH